MRLIASSNFQKEYKATFKNANDELKKELNRRYAGFRKTIFESNINTKADKTSKFNLWTNDEGAILAYSAFHSEKQNNKAKEELKLGPNVTLTIISKTKTRVFAEVDDSISSLNRLFLSAFGAQMENAQKIYDEINSSEPSIEQIYAITKTS